jgi:hypothetical protein
MSVAAATASMTIAVVLMFRSSIPAMLCRPVLFRGRRLNRTLAAALATGPSCSVQHNDGSFDPCGEAGVMARVASSHLIHQPPMTA